MVGELNNLRYEISSEICGRRDYLGSGFFPYVIVQAIFFGFFLFFIHCIRSFIVNFMTM